MKLATPLVIAIALAVSQAQCGAATTVCGGDDFNDNAKNPNLWGTDLSFGPDSSLVETNGRLEFRGTGAAARPYVWSLRPYTQNWEVTADVSVGSVPLDQPDSHVEMFLVVVNQGDTNTMGPFPGDTLSVALDLYRGTDGHIERSFEAYYYVDGNELPPRGDAVTTSQQGTVRITFDASTKTLSAYYDANGSTGGYTWTALRSVQVNAGASNWQMTSNALFGVAIGASCESYEVRPNDLAYADNFSVCDEMVSPRLSLSRREGVPLVTIEGATGTHPEIQFANAVSTNASWLALTNLVLTNTTQAVGDPSAVGAAPRFYRATLKP